eukprot:gene28864-32054_t
MSTIIKSTPISLRAFGYSMTSPNESRHVALQKAVDAHGLERVIDRLNQIKVNVEYIKQTDKDILHVLSKVPVPEDDDEPTIVENPVPVHVDDNKNARFIECMKLLNDKLCKATLDKDYAMINLMVTSMTNVIKSTL